MIDLLNQSPEIKMHVATCTSLAHFILIVKQKILHSYRLLCNVAGYYVCTVQPNMCYFGMVKPIPFQENSG